MKLGTWYVIWCAQAACPKKQELIAAIRPALKNTEWTTDEKVGEWRDLTATMPAEHFRIPQGTRKSQSRVASQIRISRHSDNDSLRQYVKEWIESPRNLNEPHRDLIWDHVRWAAQTIHLKPVAFARMSSAARICEQVCGYLCRTLNGIIQVHQEGFFSAQGNSLFPKNIRHQLRTIDTNSKRKRDTT